MKTGLKSRRQWFGATFIYWQYYQVFIHFKLFLNAAGTSTRAIIKGWGRDFPQLL